MDASIPAAQRVSYHAVTRYVQRLLGITVPVKDDAKPITCAKAHCHAAGTSIEAVRELIMRPPVLSSILAGFKRFRFGGVDYYVSDTGIIATVRRAERRPAVKLKICTDREIHQMSRRIDRRRQNPPKSGPNYQDDHHDL